MGWGTQVQQNRLGLLRDLSQAVDRVLDEGTTGALEALRKVNDRVKVTSEEWLRTEL